MKWKEELIRLKHADLKEKYPSAYEASGGKDQNIKPYEDKTANGLTKCIIEFLTFKGHYANRISTQGQAKARDVQRFDIFSGQLKTIGKTIEWTKGSTRKGTPDVDAIINGKPVKIEVKIGKDSMSKEQRAEQVKIQKSGGYYFIARDMQTFYDWYYKTF